MLKSLYNRHNHVFLEMLRTSREARRLRQRDVGRMLGRGQGTVSKVEAGVRRLDVIELRAWLGALGVDFVDFIGELDQRLRDHAAAEARLSAVQTRAAGATRRGETSPARGRHS